MTLQVSITLIAGMAFATFLIVMIFPDRFRSLGISRLSFGNAALERDTAEKQDALEKAQTSGSHEDDQDEVASDRSPEPPAKSAFSKWMEASRDRDAEGLAAALEEILEEVEDGEKEFWSAFFWDEQIKIDSSKAISGLEGLVDSKPESVWASLFLARYHDQLSDFVSARNHFSNAASRALDSGEPFALREYIEFVEKCDGIDAAERCAVSLFNEASSDKARAVISRKLGELALLKKSNGAADVWNHSSIQFDRDNHQNRFDAAYAIASKQNDSLLAMHHYFSLRGSAPDTSYALNNLASGLQGNDANSEGAFAQMMFEAASHTPAQSLANLAIHAADHGFLDYATDLLDRIPAEDRKLDRVIEAQKHLSERTASIRDTIQHSRARSDKYVQHMEVVAEHARKILLGQSSQLGASHWKSEDDKVHVEIRPGTGETLLSVQWEIKVKWPELLPWKFDGAGSGFSNSYGIQGWFHWKDEDQTLLSESERFDIHFALVSENELSVVGWKHPKGVVLLRRLRKVTG